MSACCSGGLSSVKDAITAILSPTHLCVASPTVPPLHSEHFKPCHEKDLAYCLNGGECFVIETLSGPHKHCKCREGYQGIRCDQFLPKTDSILSDPIDQLGIEFMESKAVYKRQVLSITSIAMAISLLGTLCMALYCRNKRRREKLQAHLKESRILKNYTANSTNPLEAKMRVPNGNLQMHEYCKRPPTVRQGDVCESSFARCSITALPPSCSRGTAKHHRNASLSHSPDQRTRPAHWSAPRRTPPIPRGRLNPIGGSKFSGPAYEHLQEIDPSEKEAEAQKGVYTQEENQGCDTKQDAFVHMQTPVSMETPSALPSGSRTEVRSPPQNNHSLRRPGRRRSLSPPPPFRSCSIPIIPSVQGHHDNEVSCMQTSPETTEMSTPCKEERRETTAHGRPYSSCSSAVGRQQDAVALLLEEAQEQLRVLALAHRKQEEAGVIGSGQAAAPPEARETVCFLNLTGGNTGGLGSSGPTQTQLLTLSLSHRDLVQNGQ
ncbi:pro-neuregulin-3, membrane-bound isoform [Fundulus heteroclitus]|uniref:pro-neuregulin-3, membrane-bound isoform n=1 Tax=Fundulus heteroclitus TaxID=8078 RepID=UPI00165A360C|nr:pro-neuregulin-3, membrane-bound isoform [Fundulus heteroclitus]